MKEAAPRCEPEFGISLVEIRSIRPILKPAPTQACVFAATRCTSDF
jgi:hypothetical protein